MKIENSRAVTGKTGVLADGHRGNRNFDRIYRINSNRMDRMGVLAHGHHKDRERGGFTHRPRVRDPACGTGRDHIPRVLRDRDHREKAGFLVQRASAIGTLGHGKAR
ncbi:MAG: hypothetical protein JWR26_4427 [Pedosphaera sp.]|nr:hypothetical protein [Pedosphaera sp.]